MNNYNLDLTLTTRSNTRIIIGLIMSIVSILWILLRISEGKPGLFDYTYTVIFLLGGIIHIYEGSGKSISSLFGKRYIEINDEKIKIKLNTFSNETAYKWNEIETLDMGSTSVERKDKTGYENIFHLGEFEYKTVKQIKEVIRKIADEKGVEIKD